MAVFTKCYGHALNLSVNDTIKQSINCFRDCLDTSFEFIKIIKFLPSVNRLEVTVLRYVRCVLEDGQFVQIPSPLFLSITNTF